MLKKPQSHKDTKGHEGLNRWNPTSLVRLGVFVTLWHGPVFSSLLGKRGRQKGANLRE